MLLPLFYINYNKVFDFVLIEDHANYTKKYSNRESTYNTVFLLKALTSSKIRGKYIYIFKGFFKLHKVLSICATFEVFNSLPSERTGKIPPSKYEVKIPT